MGAPLRHQRGDGEAILTIDCDAAGLSRLRDLYQRAPCRVLFPAVSPSEPLQAVLLTTSGGLTGGDLIRVTFNVASRASAVLTTQAAEKVYRAIPAAPPVACDVAVNVATGAWAEWLAQETILFNGARLRRSFCADLAPGSRMLAVESVVFGRKAMGEEFEYGFLHDAWRIRRSGRLIWADAVRMDGDIKALRSEPFGYGAAIASATVLYAGTDAAMLLEPVRSLIEGATDEAGTTVLDELLIVRLLARDAARLRARIVEVVGCIRHLAGGFARALPRVWHC